MKFPNLKYYFLLVIAMFFWGLSWPISKSSVVQASAFQVGFFRFFIATAIFLFIFIMKNYSNFPKYTIKDFSQFALLGLLGIFGYGILFLTAMKFTTAAQGATIAGIQPALLAIFSFVFFKEKLTPKWRYLGILFSFLGVISIIGLQSSIEFNKHHLIGNIIVVIAFLFWCAYSLYGKKVLENFSSLEINTWGSFFGMILFGFGAVIENNWAQIPFSSSEFWIGIVILAVLTTVVGFFCYFSAIKKIGTVRTGIFINLVPVFGTLSSIILLNEKISWTLWLGLFLISLGIIFINYPIKREKEKRKRKKEKIVEKERITKRITERITERIKKKSL